MTDVADALASLRAVADARGGDDFAALACRVRAVGDACKQPAYRCVPRVMTPTNGLIRSLYGGLSLLSAALARRCSQRVAGGRGRRGGRGCCAGDVQRHRGARVRGSRRRARHCRRPGHAADVQAGAVYCGRRRELGVCGLRRTGANEPVPGRCRHHSPAPRVGLGASRPGTSLLPAKCASYGSWEQT